MPHRELGSYKLLPALEDEAAGPSLGHTKELATVSSHVPGDFAWIYILTYFNIPKFFLKKLPYSCKRFRRARGLGPFQHRKQLLYKQFFFFKLKFVWLSLSPHSVEPGRFKAVWRQSLLPCCVVYFRNHSNMHWSGNTYAFALKEHGFVYYTPRELTRLSWAKFKVLARLCPLDNPDGEPVSWALQRPSVTCIT